MDTGDIVRYLPTSTVGKVVDIKEEDGIVWVKLDKTNLYYKKSLLEPATEAEYKTSSFKEREGKKYEGKSSVEDLDKMEREVDISEMMPSGGG